MRTIFNSFGIYAFWSSAFFGAGAPGGKTMNIFIMNLVNPSTLSRETEGEKSKAWDEVELVLRRSVTRLRVSWQQVRKQVDDALLKKDLTGHVPDEGGLVLPVDKDEVDGHSGQDDQDADS